jgi:Zn-dependent M28 family amino/carboxypeptidase
MLLKFGITVVVLLALSAAGVMHMTQMTDAPHAGELPPLTVTEKGMSDRLNAHLDWITIKIGQRNMTRYDAVERTVDYIIAETSALGFKPQRQEFDVQGRTMTNIVVEIAGSASHREIVVVGAHYDSYMRSPCANASASGTAALIELLRSFQGHSFPRTVRVVFFATGERPWGRTEDMGSRHYAEQCRTNNEEIVMAICLEALGHYSDADGTQSFPFPLNLAYPGTANFVAVFGPLASRGLVEKVVASWVSGSTFPLVAGSLPGWFPGVLNSNHESFAREGYPAVVITDTGKYRYSDIRTNFDTMARIDFERMARVVSGIGRVIVSLSRIGA